jgi:type II secretory pathway pseudopilin PulG
MGETRSRTGQRHLARSCAHAEVRADVHAHAPRRRASQGGYTYLALLILLAIISITAAASAELGAIYQRRMAEKELLAVGAEFQRALQSYASATPIGQPTQPRTLEDLLRDPRYPNVVRHLRRVHDDPMTGKGDWILMMSPDGQTIIGIHSASHARPIQISHFPAAFQGFANRKSYSDWVFVARFPTLTQGQRPPDGPVTPNGDAPGMGDGGSSNNNGSSSGGPFGSSPFGGASSSRSPGGSLGGSFGGSSNGSAPAAPFSGGSPFNGSRFGDAPASQ